MAGVHPQACATERLGWYKDVELVDECFVNTTTFDVFAERVQREAESLLQQKLDSWNKEGTFEHGLSVYSRPTRASKLVIVRGEVEIAAEANALFRFLSSAEGSRLLDPATTSKNSKHCVRLPWHDRATIVYEDAAMADELAQRTFVACNLVDHEKRLFNSKSILHPELPPGGDGTIRAVKTIAYRTSALKMRSEEAVSHACKLELLSWVDMRGSDVPSDLANEFATESSLQEFVARLFAALPSEAPRPAAPGCCCLS